MYKRQIKDIVREVEAGETFVGTVTRMLSFGVFIEVLPGKEGLLHVSEISNYRVPTLEDAFEIGDRVLVTVKEIDDMHRVNLSRKRILDKLDELALDPVSYTHLVVSAFLVLAGKICLSANIYDIFCFANINLKYSKIQL